MFALKHEPNGIAALRQHHIERMANEALDQGALLTAEDVVFRIFNCGLRTISRAVTELARQGIVVRLCHDNLVNFLFGQTLLD